MYVTIAAAILLTLVVGAPILIVPIVLLGVLALVALAVITRLRDTTISPGGTGPAGVPTTGDASYDPVGDARR